MRESRGRGRAAVCSVIGQGEGKSLTGLNLGPRVTYLYIERLSGLNPGLVWASTFFLRRSS